MAKKHSFDTHSRFLSFFSGDQGNENRENLELFLYTYLLLTEFEVRTVDYGSARAINRRGKRGSVTNGTDRKDEVSKKFIISLLCV